MDDVDWVEEPLPGDLGNKVDPMEKSPFVFGDIRDQRAKLVLGQPGRANGRRVEFEGPPELERTCLVVADSYAVRVVPFLAESFRRLVFGHIPTLDYELVEEVQPDVVITIFSERFLIEVAGGPGRRPRCGSWRPRSSPPARYCGPGGSRRTGSTPPVAGRRTCDLTALQQQLDVVRRPSGVRWSIGKPTRLAAVTVQQHHV